MGSAFIDFIKVSVSVLAEPEIWLCLGPLMKPEPELLTFHRDLKG